ncbi:MAG: cytidine deaminase [Gemmatimonadaceae bacterium]
MTEAESDGDAMCAAAFAAMQRAYAPYSNFRVGAALRSTHGSVFLGCNVENAAFSSGICAERGALMTAVAQGVRDFDYLVVATEASEPVAPCGACRQMLEEFSPDLRILSCTAAGAQERWTLADLLPHPFTARSMDRA